MTHICIFAECERRLPVLPDTAALFWQQMVDTRPRLGRMLWPAPLLCPHPAASHLTQASFLSSFPRGHLAVPVIAWTPPRASKPLPASPPINPAPRTAAPTLAWPSLSAAPRPGAPGCPPGLQSSLALSRPPRDLPADPSRSRERRGGGC